MLVCMASDGHKAMDEGFDLIKHIDFKDEAPYLVFDLSKNGNLALAKW